MKVNKITFWGQEIVLAKGKPKEEFKVANVKLEIPELNDGIVYTLSELGTGFKRFAIAFRNDDIAESTIAHEVWHLFWNIVELVSHGDTTFTAEELSKESYAYLFGELFKEINIRV